MPQNVAVEEFCEKLGENLRDVTPAWLPANAVVTAPMIRPLTMGQLTGNLLETHLLCFMTNDT
jgi:hypothetical protein